MRLLYYTDQVYMHGGLERVLANKLNYFSEHTAIELHVITFQQENNLPCYPINNNVTFHDLKINYNRDISFLHPSNLKHAPRHYLRLKRKIKEIQPDVIVVCNYEFGFYFIPLIAKKAIKIKEFHSSRHFNNIKRLKNKNLLKGLKYKLSDYFEAKYEHLVLLTTDEQRYFKTNNTVVIPNAIHNIGKKAAALGHDGSPAARSIAVNFAALMLKNKGHYIEVSGKLKDIMVAKGVPIVTDEETIRTALKGKDIEMNDDGTYQRSLGGEIHTKTMMGNPL